MRMTSTSTGRVLTFINYEHVFQFYKQIESLVSFLATYRLETEISIESNSAQYETTQPDPLTELFLMHQDTDNNSAHESTISVTQEDSEYEENERCVSPNAMQYNATPNKNSPYTFVPCTSPFADWATDW
jgi:hypothetical protein